MCEQTEVQYLEGDVVWVKLGSCWWPAEVQDIKKLPEEVQEDLRRDPIAAVKFFDEDKYEYVQKLDHICMYNCRRKTEFIKKGLDMYRTKKKEGSSFMDKFPADVAKAESMTGGDPQILSDSEFAPKEKTAWKSIFGEDKKSTSPTEWFIKPGKGNKNILCTPDVKSPKPANRRYITHPRLLRVLRGEKDDHEIRIRVQPSPNIDESEKSGPYHCPTCEFTSNRLNVIILHNKYHSNLPQTNRGRGKGKISLKADSSVGSLTGRGSGKGRIKQTQNNLSVDELSEKECQSESETSQKISRTKDKGTKPDRSPDNSTLEKLTEAPVQSGDVRLLEKKGEKKTIFGKRKISKKKELSSKRKKPNDEIREKLLADWEDDEDDEQEEQEIELLKQVLNKNCNNDNSSKVKEMSCFDFDESADSMLDVELEERAKKFAENLRFPRVAEDRDSLQKQKVPNVKSPETASTADKEPNKEMQKVPIIPEIHSSEQEETEMKSVDTDNCQKSNVVGSGILYTSVIVNMKDTVGNHGTEPKEPSELVNNENLSEKEGFSQLSSLQHIDSNVECKREIKKEELSVSEDLAAEFESVMAETAIPDLPTIPENKIVANRPPTPEDSAEAASEVSIDEKYDVNAGVTKTDSYVSEAVHEQNFCEGLNDVSMNDSVNKEEINDPPESKFGIESSSTENFTQSSKSVAPLFMDPDEFQETSTDDHLKHEIKQEDPLKYSEEIAESKNNILCLPEHNSDEKSVQQSEAKYEQLFSDENYHTASDDIEEKMESMGLPKTESEVKDEVNIKEEEDDDSENKIKLFSEISETLEDPLSSSTLHGSESDIAVKSEALVEDTPIKAEDEGVATSDEKKSPQETNLADEDELDINSMPVVMTDAFIKEEFDNGGSISQYPGGSSVVNAGQQSAGSIFVTPSNESVSLIGPVSSVKATNGGNTVVKILKSTSSQGTKVSGLKTILPNKLGSKYVIIQQASGQQQRYKGKPLQQCVTLKTLNQAQANSSASKKLLIMKTSQTAGTPGVQSVLTTSSKIAAVGQHVLTSSGAIVTAVPANKAVLPKGAKLLPLSQQHLKVVTGGTKQRLTMQSTKTKVSLPSMQSLRKVNVVQAPTGQIVGTSKSKNSTILIHSPQVTSSAPSNQTIVGSNSNQNVTQVALKPQVVRTKQPSSSGTSLQRVLLTTGAHSTLQTQQRPLVTKAIAQPQFKVVQRVQIPKSATVVVSSDNIKKGMPLLSQNQAGQKAGQVKILPQTKQKTNTGRIVSVQNAKQKKCVQPLPAISTIGITQALPAVQVFQQAEALAQPLVASENSVSSSSSPVTTSTIQQSPTTGSILTTEQLAQMMGAPGGQIATDGGTLVLVTINESGNLQPFDNSTLVAYDDSVGQNSKPTNALYIDSSTLGSQNDLDKLIFTLNNQVASTAGLVNVEQQLSPHTTDQQSSVFNIDNGSKTPAPPGCNQDILAAALANTDVFQPEAPNVAPDPINNDNQVGFLEPSSIINVSSTTLHQATILLPSVTTAGLPPAAPGVLETSLTLNQPIMTPLEVPSTITQLENPPPPPSTSMQLAESSLIIPTSTVSETAKSVDSPVSSSTVVTPLPSAKLVSEGAGEISHVQNESSDELTQSSVETSQKTDEVLTALDSGSGVTSSEVTEKLSSDYVAVAEAASAQVPHISSPNGSRDGNRTIDSEFQQMPESTSEIGYTKKLNEQELSTSCVVETKENSEGIDSSVQVIDSSALVTQKLDSSSEAVATTTSNNVLNKDEHSPQRREDSSPINCVESTSENMLMGGSVSAPQVNDMGIAEGTSVVSEEINSSPVVTDSDRRTVPSVLSENETNPETGPSKEESERLALGLDDKKSWSNKTKLLPGIVSPKDNELFTEGDLVWIKVWNLYWPGIITKIKKKCNKAVVKIVQACKQKKAYTKSFKDLIDFRNTERNQKLLNSGKEENHDVEDAYRRAMDFYDKQNLENAVVTCKKRNINKKSEESSDVRVEQKINVASKSTTKIAIDEDVAQIEKLFESFGKVPSDHDDTDDECCPAQMLATPSPKTANPESLKIIKFVKKPTCLRFLKGILEGRHHSERHKVFMTGSLSERRILRSSAGFGPLDEEQVHVVYVKLSEYLLSIAPRGYVDNPSTYVFDVWMPEAIIFALQKIRKIKKEEAESVFRVFTLSQ